MISAREIILAIGFFVVAMSWIQVFGRKGRTTGRIVEFVWSGRRGFRSRKPRIEFAVDGRQYSFIPSVVIFGDVREEKLGTTVPVAYNPENPKDADLGLPGRMFGPPVILTCAYAVALYIAFFRASGP